MMHDVVHEERTKSAQEMEIRSSTRMSSSLSLKKRKAFFVKFEAEVRDAGQVRDPRPTEIADASHHLRGST